MSTFIATADTGMAQKVSPLRNDCRECATRRVCPALYLAKDLPKDVYRQLFQSRPGKAGKHLFHAGDKLTAFHIVKSGSYKTYLTSESGNEFITGFHSPGDVLGADGLANHEHELSAMALESSSVCSVSWAKLENAVKRFSSDWIVQQACQQALRKSHLFLVNLRNKANADARVAFFLLNQSDSHRARGHSDHEFRLEMKRGDMANYLGLTLETVSRALHRLQDDRLLTVNGRLIAIANRNKLREIADLPPLPEKMSA